MADYFSMSFAKARAQDLVGKKVWFTEVEGEAKRQGVVVGYYYDAAKVIMECDSAVKWSVDPDLSYFTMLRPLRQHGFRQYCMVDPHTIDTSRPGKTSLHPHECRRCHWPALEIFRTVECTNISCKNYKA
jgi:hypothetical protein